MRRRPAVLPALLPALLLAAALPAPAGAARARDTPRPITASKHLWATVNVCDTPGHPDGVGIRGSMPGSGFRDERMFMRFGVQYLRPDGTWASVGPDGVSDWVDVGSARYRRRQGGRTFTITPPATGSYTLRGLVTFEWRRNGEVVRKVRRRTTAGHEDARGGDPAGFSAATCELR